MMGTVANWNLDRAFGFIKRDDGQPDIFAHVTALHGGMSLTPGERVSFDIGEGRDGKMKAIDVRRRDSNAAAAGAVFGASASLIEGKATGDVAQPAPRFGD